MYITGIVIRTSLSPREANEIQSSMEFNNVESGNFASA